MNHSLRATCASRMYDNNVPEQIIKETTGHKSECVRIYKRTSEVLKEVASKTVSGENPSKKLKLEESNESGDETSKVEKQDELLTYDEMIEMLTKLKKKFGKKLYPKSRLKAHRLVKQAKKVSIDLNMNMKFTK